MILFVNGCVRENSRTLELARAVLEREGDEVREVCLYRDGPKGLTGQTLRLRDELLAKGELSHPMFRWAKDFSRADTIVIAAPYWDLMFPAAVRAYLEEVSVSGITFRYGEDGIPRGMCSAKRLIYVTTAGGPIVQNFGFQYVQALAQTFYGIPEVSLVKAEGLDIWGADPAGILARAKEEVLAAKRDRGDIPGRKIIVLSFDDGTVYDRRFVELLERHGIPGTFNLNSGLGGFVWYCGDHPIARPEPAEVAQLYKNHEVACHTVHHHDLTTLTREGLVWQVEEDRRRLEEIFGRGGLGFAVPFDRCGEREVDIIRGETGVEYIRLSELSDSFAPPADPWHIPIHGLFNQPDIRDRLSAFARSELPLSLFVLCGHSYECEVEERWEEMEQLLVWMKKLPGVEFMTLMDFVRLVWPKEG